MFLQYRTQGLILKKENRGEADQLFTVYTKDFGRLEILGKAIRKISSKLRAGMEVFYLSEIEFIQGKTYKTLTDSILIKRFQNFRKSLARLKIAYKISEVLDNLIKGQEPDERIWELISEVFQKLNSLEFSFVHLQLIYFYFFWNLMSILGYRPELYYCLGCQKKLTPGKLYFNKIEGGVICQDCFKKTKIGQEINIDIIKILRLLLEQDLRALRRLKIAKDHLEPLALVSENYLSLILERR